MDKSTGVLKLCEEVMGAPLPPVAELKGGETVIFKSGTECEGMMGYVSQIEKDGTLGVKLGNANKFQVNPADLLLVTYGK